MKKKTNKKKEKKTFSERMSMPVNCWLLGNYLTIRFLFITKARTPLIKCQIFLGCLLRVAAVLGHGIMAVNEAKYLFSKT